MSGSKINPLRIILTVIILSTLVFVIIVLFPYLWVIWYMASLLFYYVSTERVGESIYSRIGNKIYIGDHVRGEVTYIDGVDVDSFQSVGRELGKDNSYVYFKEEKLKLDPETFRSFDEYNCYFIDKSAIYSDNGEFLSKELNSFQLLEHDEPYECLARDSLSMYFKGVKLKNSDSNTFEIIERRIFKDKNNVYLGGKILEGADPSTFVIIGEETFKDKNNVYLGGKILEGADPSTYTFITRVWSYDKNKVYVDGNIVNKLVPEDLKKVYNTKYAKLIDSPNHNLISQGGIMFTNRSLTPYYNAVINSDKVYYIED